MTDPRDDIVHYLSSQVIGPQDGEDEKLHEPPHRRYLTGILFPQEAAVDEELQEDIADDDAGLGDEDSTGDPVAMSAQQLPSSLGLSFVLRDWHSVSVDITCATYTAEGKGTWRRVATSLQGQAAITVAAPDRAGRAPSVAVMGGAASIESTWRPLGAGALVTVSLVNQARLPATGKLDAADCLFQVGIRVNSDHIGPYPSPMRIQSGDEEAELALQYREVPTFAIGHGCSADWEQTESPVPTWVASSHLPQRDIPAVSFDLAEDRGTELGSVLDLNFLHGIAERPAEIVRALDAFVDAYRDWLSKRLTEAETLPTRHRVAATRILERVERAEQRMRAGVRRLEQDDDVRLAFSMMNRAMLMQMVHAGQAYAGRVRERGEPVPADPEWSAEHRSWRPFQLGFLLLSLNSALDESDADRDVIDLIWFPTGGGKTEAYLGLMALTILHRRLTLGDAGGGTTVITRYTLRLLTSQQFQRAATLICALELQRRQGAARMGAEPISIGVWLGGDNSPNTFADAVALETALREGEYTSRSFQVEGCPWCGTRVIPSAGAPDEAWGVHATADSFRLHCPSTSCEFHSALPVSSVDEDLYERPPTCLIGTVDKFARLTWTDRAGILLGGADTPGPALVIQDEFHLISGPLGTVVGLYEAAFDVVMARRGARPKVVASTATIRRAPEQGRGVFGRETALFPPAGLRASDSYFVRNDPRGQGRRYVGLMPQGHTPLTGMVHTSAALLQAPEDLDLPSPSDDAFWTLVAYHNSLRELGKTVTLAHDDIPARLSVIAQAEDGVRRLTDDDIVELTGNIPAAEIPRNIELLKRSRAEGGAVSFVASTNMLSVGVDVPRLGLMLVVGQPKTTAEYIQASSRVGRKTPGLVVTLYSGNKPRDRSHYESFVAYHSSLYRYVEPTSVTPFSVPARNRALHAGLVILARHALGLGGNEDAKSFDPDSQDLADVIEDFLARVKIADPAEVDAVREHLTSLAAEWSYNALQALPVGGLRYNTSGKQHHGLLRRFGPNNHGVWPTLDSMRNVDTEVRMRIRGEQP